MMQILLKIIISVAVILTATTIGKKLPSTAGLIGVMPLTGAIVLVWLYMDKKGDSKTMLDFTTGALWGILPSIFFFLIAFFCFKKNLPLPVILATSFGGWLVAACIHQWALK